MSITEKESEITQIKFSPKKISNIDEKLVIPGYKFIIFFFLLDGLFILFDFFLERVHIFLVKNRL
jgi:hypothetical protein